MNAGAQLGATAWVRYTNAIMRLWLAAGILAPGTPARAAGVAEQAALAGVTEFNAACGAWDTDRFTADTEKCTEAVKKNPTCSFYFSWLGTAHFPHMLQRRSETAAAVNTAREAAFPAPNTPIKLDERHVESHALLGTPYRMQIEGNLTPAARFGLRAQKDREQAPAWGSEDPRVIYLMGTCQFSTEKKRSVARDSHATLQAVEKLFETETDQPTGPLDPRGGYCSCLTFIGRAQELPRRHAEAAQYFRKALSRPPANDEAQAGLGQVTDEKRSLPGMEPWDWR